MKEFRKNKQGLFICEECNRLFIYKKGLSKHVNKFHILKEYYDKWIKEEGEGICKICGNPTKFTGLKRLYLICCSKNCSDKYRYLRIEEENTKKYGLKNSYQREDIKEKIKKTNLKKYGVKCPLQNNEIIKKTKITKLKKYGDENYKNYKKQKQTKKEKYGNENYNNIEKFKKPSLQKYGFENPNQNLKVFCKGEKTRFHSYNYLSTNIHYRGNYELDFLEKYYNKLDIQNAPFIKYFFENKNKIYFPDFYISSLNLIVEIKNSYLAKKDKKIIEAKRKATIANGFNYIMIINKNYIMFENLISKVTEHL
jgi:uncharacterized C2H2 Zn-finger protein